MIERIERSKGEADQPQNLKPHPLAALVRPPTEEEYQALKASIDANGLRDPIITRYEGLCLDGNSRLRASVELGRTDELEVEDLDPHDDPVDFVLDANYHRRHLSSADRSGTASRLRELGLTQAQIAQKLRVSHQTVGRDLKRRLVRKPGTGLNVQRGHSEAAGQSAATGQINASQAQPRTILNRRGQKRPAAYRQPKHSGSRRRSSVIDMSGEASLIDLGTKFDRALERGLQQLAVGDARISARLWSVLENIADKVEDYRHYRED